MNESSTAREGIQTTGALEVELPCGVLATLSACALGSGPGLRGGTGWRVETVVLCDEDSWHLTYPATEPTEAAMFAACESAESRDAIERDMEDYDR